MAVAAIRLLRLRLDLPAYDPSQPDNGRSSARNALIAVIEFLSVLFPDLATLPLSLQELLQGLVDLEQGRGDAAWLEELRAEILAFPHGAHDDQVDSISQAIAWLSRPRNRASAVGA
jgi:hypothetical protein